MSLNPYYIPKPGRSPGVLSGVPRAWGAITARSGSDITQPEVQSAATGQGYGAWLFDTESAAISAAITFELGSAGLGTTWPTEISYTTYDTVVSRSVVRAGTSWITLAAGGTSTTGGRATTDITRAKVEALILPAGPYRYKYLTEVDAIAAGITAAVSALGLGLQKSLTSTQWNNLISQATTLAQTYYVTLRTSV